MVKNELPKSDLNKLELSFPKESYDSLEKFKEMLFKAMSESAKILLTRGLDEYERQQEQEQEHNSVGPSNQ